MSHGSVWPEPLPAGACVRTGAPDGFILLESLCKEQATCVPWASGRSLLAMAALRWVLSAASS